jgi:uncharacterized membrane protein
MSDLLTAITVVTAVSCGLVGGVFFAFSNFVMKALGRLDPAKGAAAMQSINVTVINPLFMTAVFGTTLVCIVIAVWALTVLDEDYAPYLLGGAALYVIGVAGMTIGFHVPRNNALARVDPHSAEGADVWRRYLREWTAGNHVRTVSGLAAVAALIVALHLG